MIIAQYGNFVLATKVFANDHEYYVRDLEVQRVAKDGTNVSIAYFNEDGALVSCGRRLLDNMETQDDIDNVKKLAELFVLIYDGINAKSGL